MDIPTKNLGQYIREKGINVMNMSRATGIPYGALYDSLLSAPMIKCKKTPKKKCRFMAERRKKR